MKWVTSGFEFGNSMIRFGVYSWIGDGVIEIHNSQAFDPCIRQSGNRFRSVCSGNKKPASYKEWISVHVSHSPTQKSFRLWRIVPRLLFGFSFTVHCPDRKFTRLQEIFWKKSADFTHVKSNSNIKKLLFIINLSKFS